MRQVICPNCGADEFAEMGNYRICAYCESKYIIEKEDFPKNSPTISINEDIQELLRKCKAEPYKAKHYANLILDLDPFNADAKKYL